MTKPRVALITTGGTIASSVRPNSTGPEAALDASALIAMAPSIRDHADIEVAEPFRINSWNMTVPRMIRIARVIRNFGATGFDGFVVTHGTDTLEETAFGLDLLWHDDRPVVITGSMRQPAEPGFDGTANLLGAVMVAASPAARGLGVLAVVGDHVHAAQYVTKLHTTAVTAFDSRGAHPVGSIDVRGLRILWRPRRIASLPFAHKGTARVYVIKAAAGMDARAVSLLVDSGADGLVIEAFGSGNVFGPWTGSLRKAAKRIPVVVVSRVPHGRVTATYGGYGGGATLQQLGIILGGDLSGPKARIALILALAAGMTREDVSRFFGSLIA